MSWMAILMYICFIGTEEWNLLNASCTGTSNSFTLIVYYLNIKFLFNLELGKKNQPKSEIIHKTVFSSPPDLYLLLRFPSQCLVRMISCWAAAEPAAYGPTASSHRMRTHRAWTTCWLSVCRVMESYFLEVETTASGAGSGTTTSERRQAPLETLYFSHPITTTQTSLQAQTLRSRIPIKQVNVVIGWFNKKTTTIN